jgi:chemotaxis family two-component system response regulator Rcp1
MRILLKFFRLRTAPDDVRLTREAFKDAKVHINLHVASDAGAMDFLNREGEHANAPRPYLILLDLNLPKRDRREVVEEIKDSPTLKKYSGSCLTTSASSRPMRAGPSRGML